MKENSNKRTLAHNFQCMFHWVCKRNSYSLSREDICLENTQRTKSWSGRSWNGAVANEDGSHVYAPMYRPTNETRMYDKYIKPIDLIRGVDERNVGLKAPFWHLWWSYCSISSQLLPLNNMAIILKKKKKPPPSDRFLQKPVLNWCGKLEACSIIVIGHEAGIAYRL